ncbi:MAG: elongation factor G [Planctomycetia bacterium]
MAPSPALARLRNFGICAHIDAGKTTVSERILFYTGKEHAMGEVHEGSAKMDYLPEEQERGITITAAATTIGWREHVLNLIDTPGHVDFTAEVERSLRVLDGAVVVFDAVSGVEAQSETVWRQADRYRVPRLCFINKMDRGGADFDAAVASIRERLGAPVAVVARPLGRGDGFEGVIDLLTREVVRFAGEQGRQVQREPVPAALADEVELHRSELVEALADHDDALAERYLSGAALEAGELREALRRATLATRLFPVLCGAALRNMGVQMRRDGGVDWLPSPLDVGAVRGHDPADPARERRVEPDAAAPLCALVFKILTDAHGDLTFVRVYGGTLQQGQGLWNPRLAKHERAMRLLRMHANEREPVERAGPGEIVALVGPRLSATGDTLCDKADPVVLEPIRFPLPVISMAIEPRTNADRDRLHEALARLGREDPTFVTSQHEETGQTIIAGMGELHLEVLKNRLTRDFGIEANVGAPRVSYRQTVRGRAEVAFRFERLVAGKPQQAEVRLAVEALPGGGGLEVLAAVPAGALEPRYVAAALEGARFAAQGGLGFPMVDLRVTVTGGRAHETESSEMAFQAAAGEAFRQAAEQAGLVLLEPVMRFEVSTPNEFVGPVTADLVRRGALLEGDDLRGDLRLIRGSVPLARMFGYSTAVRSLTQGRAGYSMEPAGYAPAPPEVAAQLLMS